MNSVPSEWIRITHQDVADFLKSRGYTLPESCPKCQFTPWDQVFSNPHGEITVISRQNPMAQYWNYEFCCPHCGYREAFAGWPLINWILTQR